MDKTIQITVRNKIAVKTCETVYICGNSDFAVHFSFDDEWAAHTLKTARFILNDGSFVDQPFSSDTCPVPILKNTFSFNLGVYAGNLSTTTPAYCPAKKSILCPGGTPKDPEPDVYNEIIDLINNGKVKGEPGASGVHVGPDEPPHDANVWIVPEGEATAGQKYELMQKVVVAEEGVAHILYDFTEDVIAVMFKTKTLPKETATSGYAYVTVHDKKGNYKTNAVGAYIDNMHNTTERNSTSIVLPVFGRWFGWCLGSVAGAYMNSGISNYPNEQGLYGLDVYPYIQSARVYGRNNFPFGIGDEIEIWAVRA